MSKITLNYIIEPYKKDTKSCETFLWTPLYFIGKILPNNLKIILLFILFLPSAGQAQISEIVDIGGYFKELGQISLNNDFSEIRYNNSLQNRLESEWKFSDSFEFQADLRTRLISGYNINHMPGADSFYENDPGFFDLTLVPFSTDYTVLQSQIDRFYGSFYSGDFELHAGRQRINWGRTFVWNPNDLFNNYAFLNFDYEERPGVDAVLAQYNWGFASSAQLGYRIANSFDKSVIAGMVRTHWGDYDIQLLAGHYLDKATVGLGWAGYIRGAGFKGEISYFHPEEEFFDETGHFTATAGFDYILPSGLYLQSELLYNGGYNSQGNPLNTLVQPPSADNLFISKTGFFLNGSYQLHPLVNGTLSFLGSFDRSIFIFIPQITVSVSENVDFLLLSQLLKGHVFNPSVETPNLFFFRLKWSY